MSKKKNKENTEIERLKNRYKVKPDYFLFWFFIIVGIGFCIAGIIATYLEYEVGEGFITIGCGQFAAGIFNFLLEKTSALELAFEKLSEDMIQLMKNQNKNKQND